MQNLSFWSNLLKLRKKLKWVIITPDDENGPDSEHSIQHALSTECNVHKKWILDSRATCHVCNQQSLFTHYTTSAKAIECSIGLWLKSAGNWTGECSAHDESTQQQNQQAYTS